MKRIGKVFKVPLLAQEIREQIFRWKENLHLGQAQTDVKHWLNFSILINQNS